MDKNGWFSPAWREKYRVRISFIFGLILLWRAQPRIFFLLIAGLLISFLGILIRQWAAGCVKKMDELCVSGPYAIVRHPLYAGSFLAAAGFILSTISFSYAFILSKPYGDRSLLFFALLWILYDSIYLPKVAKEEEDLKSKFGERYTRYCETVPRIVPTHLDWRKFDFRSFDLKLWIKNKEYWSIVGYLLVSAVLFFRYLYRV